MREASPVSSIISYHIASWPPSLDPLNQAHPTPPSQAFSPQERPPLTIPFTACPQRSLASRPRPQPEGHPLPRSQDPQAERLPFLPVNIRRNWGHPTSTICPSAEDGQQLMLSHSPLQPAKRSSSVRQGASMGKGPPPPPVTIPSTLAC